MELFVMANVDQDGFLIPMVVNNMISHGDPLPWEDPLPFGERLMRKLTRGADTGGKVYYLLSQGLMDNLLWEGLQQATSGGRPPIEYLPIPAWLGENLPYQTVFLPNGEILCYGELGLHLEPLPDMYPGNSLLYWPENLNWFRYSSEGELLEEFTVPFPQHRDWQSKFYDQAETVSTTRSGSSFVGGRFIMGGGAPFGGPSAQSADDKLRMDHTTRFIDGYKITHSFSYDSDAASRRIYRPISSSYEIHSVVDWLGNPVPMDQPAAPYQTAYLKEFGRTTLEQEYQRQVDEGITDPAALSPFLGMENGPRIVDPAPRKPALFAESWSQDGFMRVAVKPLDDPDNPYADEYQPWDYWVFEQIGQDDPSRSVIVPGLHERRRDDIKAAEAAGDDEEAKRLARSPIRFTFDPENQGRNFSVRIDKDGCVQPLLRPMEMPVREAVSTWIPRDVYALYPSASPIIMQNYYVSGYGVMGPELQEAYLLAKYREQAVEYPQVPEWLIENPVGAATFLPDGNIVLYEEPGSCYEQMYMPYRDPDQSRDDEYVRPEVDYPSYLYSPTGELLRTEIGNNPNEYALYLYPAYKEIKAKAEAEGHKLEHRSGYILVTSGDVEHLPDGSYQWPEVLEAYTADGQQISIYDSIPVSSKPSGITMMQWERIRDLYLVQQLQSGDQELDEH